MLASETFPLLSTAFLQYHKQDFCWVGWWKHMEEKGKHKNAFMDMKYIKLHDKKKLS